MSEVKYYELSFDLKGSIKMIRSESMNVLVALNEFLDNSLDAGATEIRIIEQGNDLVIRDNGQGFESLGESVVVGKSKKKGRGKIGRHGVGMKKACIKFSSATTVKSMGNQLYVPWDDVVAGMVEPMFPEQSCELVSGTEVTLHKFSRMRRTQAIQPAGLAKTYAMLLNYDVAKIYYNGEPLRMLELPTFTKKIDKEIEWRGKGARIIGGIYPTDDPCRKNWAGYYAYYNGRLIEGPILEHGRGDLACSNFVYQIYLQDGEKNWALSTHKDEVEDLQEFLEHIFDNYTGEHLEQAAKDSEVIELREVERFISDQLNGKARAGRNNGNHEKEGTVAPKNTGRRRKTTNVPNGPGDLQASTIAMENRQNKKPKSIGFTFEKMDGDTFGLCEKAAKGKRHWKFNLNNRFVEYHKTDKDALAPLMVVINALCDAIGEDFLFENDTLNRALEGAGYHLDGTADNYRS